MDGTREGNMVKERKHLISIPEPTKEKIGLAKKKILHISGVFRQNRLGMTGLVILLAFIVMAVFAAQIMWIFAQIAGWDYPYGPFDRVERMGVGTAPSDDHWFGTDQFGRDILSRLLYGSRVSLLVGVVATVVSMGLGTLVGLLSGYWGGWKDEVLMRLTDVFLVLPWLVLMIVLAALMPGGSSVSKVIIVIGITGWSGTARIVRAQVLSVGQRAFVERARAIGAGDFHIVGKHVFPNVFPLVFANSILTIAIAILAESTLSFIGLGPLHTQVVTWGNMLENATSGGAMASGLYLWIMMPGFCIVLVVLGFTFVGYALDEIFNPKLRKR
jgi:peptide/nickel transport system permease protein